MNELPHRPSPPSRNGRAQHPASVGTGTPAPGAGRRCPGCGAAGVRYLRSTGRWERDPAGAFSFTYVTFCAACGHEYEPPAE